MCQYITSDIAYSFEMAFTPMRNEQDNVSLRLQNELISLATSDENFEYIMAAVAVAVVLAGVIVVTPVFIRVICNKSRVFAIFSHVTSEEIHRVISSCRKLDTKRIRFKREWLSQLSDQQEEFWRKVRTGSRAKRSPKVHNAKDKEALQSLGQSPAEGKPAAPAEEPEKQQTLKEDPAPDPKLLMRVRLLSAIEYLSLCIIRDFSSSLRNKSIARLAFSVILFMGYIAFKIYFNYYVHSVNNEAVDMFFVFQNRGIYTTSAALFLKEVIANGNKELSMRNTSMQIASFHHTIDGDGKLYMMDLVDRLTEIEKKCNEFAKSASHAIYGDFLSLQARAETSEFCGISDSYNYSQTIRTSLL